MAAPTAAEIRDWSKVDFDALDYGTDPELQRLVDRSIADLGRWTGQSWSGAGAFSNIDMASNMEPVAQEAVQKLTEWRAFRSQEDTVETLGDFDLISSFSAGSYSESRRGGKDAREAALAMLHALLWPLMTLDKQDEWIQMMGGPNAPMFAVTEVDWSGMGWGTDSGYGGHGALPMDPYPPITD